MRRFAITAALASILATGCNENGPGGLQAGDGARLQERVDAARGRPLLLSFWATWCKPCVEEIPDLVALHEDRGLGVRILAVSLDAFLEGNDAAVGVVREFLTQTPTPYEHVVYQGTQDDILERFALPGNIPYAILYDADGREVDRFDGRISTEIVRAALTRTAGL